MPKRALFIHVLFLIQAKEILHSIAEEAIWNAQSPSGCCEQYVLHDQ